MYTFFQTNVSPISQKESMAIMSKRHTTFQLFAFMSIVTITFLLSCGESVRPIEDVTLQLKKEIKATYPELNNLNLELTYKGKDSGFGSLNLYKGVLRASLSKIGDVMYILDVSEFNGDLDWTCTATEETSYKISEYNERQRINAELKAFDNKWGGKWIGTDNNDDFDRTFTLTINPDGTLSEYGVYHNLNTGNIFKETLEGNWSYIDSDVIRFHMEAERNYHGVIKTFVRNGYFRSDGLMSASLDFNQAYQEYVRTGGR
ncbi:MAG: hypothetical protein IJJ94_07600 [Bacteroidaceae bacterium]|nr:hypothetical protein [Bacteroidaceae bacterium]